MSDWLARERWTEQGKARQTTMSRLVIRRGVGEKPKLKYWMERVLGLHNYGICNSGIPFIGGQYMQVLERMWLRTESECR